MRSHKYHPPYIGPAGATPLPRTDARAAGADSAVLASAVEALVVAVDFVAAAPADDDDWTVRHPAGEKRLQPLCPLLTSSFHPLR